MAKDGTQAEKFVAAHCVATFLSLWGIANPVGKDKGKELCDYIVVCNPDVVIISVKDITLSQAEDEVAAKRWTRSAVDASVAAVYGAERILGSMTEVRSKDGRCLTLPSVASRRIHRICVAFGSSGKVALPMGDLGKGFVHVLDEVSFTAIIRELDTIADFVEYLEAKKNFVESGKKLIVPGEEQLLALYVHGNRSFPEGHDLLLLDDTLWVGLTSERSYAERRKEDSRSYSWDRTIEFVAKDLLANNLLFADPPDQTEEVLRVMARENRFQRRYLSDLMTEVFTSKDIRGRIVRSESGVVYVFAAFPRDEDRKYRIAELAARCYVARSRFKDEQCKVVGIATERANDGKMGLSFDLFLVDVPQWTLELEAKAEEARSTLGIFSKPRVTMRHVDEYPKSDS